MTIHKRITAAQNKQAQNKASKSRARRYSKLFKRRQKQKEKDKKLKKLTDSGMGPMEALFNLEYNKGASND